MKNTIIEKIDLGNNESLNVGIIENLDGTFTAVSLTASTDFKTKNGAKNWLSKRGY